MTNIKNHHVLNSCNSFTVAKLIFQSVLFGKVLQSLLEEEYEKIKKSEEQAGF